MKNSYLTFTVPFLVLEPYSCMMALLKISMKPVLTLSLSLISFLLPSAPVLAADTYTLYGPATLASVETAPSSFLHLHADSALPGSSVVIPFPDGTTLADLSHLSFEYLLLEGRCDQQQLEVALVLQDGDRHFQTLSTFPCQPSLTAWIPGLWHTTDNLFHPDTTYAVASSLDAPPVSLATLASTYSQTPVIELRLSVKSAGVDATNTLLIERLDYNGQSFTFDGPESLTYTCTAAESQLKPTTFPGPVKNLGLCFPHFSFF